MFLVAFIFFLALVLALYVGAGSLLSAAPALATQTGHILTFFNFIIGNMKNMQSFFPILDLALVFGAFLLTETIVLSFKIIMMFIKNAAKK